MRGGPVRERALVLRTIKLGDTSKIVSVLTSTYGRIKLVAKGARQVRSRWSGLLEPGNQIEVLVYVKPGRDLWMMSDASLERAALTGASSLDKLSHLFAALELADRLLPEQQPSPEVDLVYQRFLDRWHDAGSSGVGPLFFRLEFELCDALGVGLDLTYCAHCARRLDQAERILHHAADGELRCDRCATGGGHWLHHESIVVIDELSNGPAGLAMSPESRRQIGRLLHEHMTYHLPNYRLPRSLFWLAEENPPRKAGRE